MSPSKLEVLVDLGPQPDQRVVEKTLDMLRAQDHVKEAIFKEGAILVETTLPSSQVLDMVTKMSGKRAVLQGFGDSVSAVAMLSNESCSSGKVMGVVRFQQTEGGALIADGTIDGLSPGLHGLHVRASGDLSQGCASLGEHYNPTGAPHGGPGAPAARRHAGDLGNISADGSGRASFRILDSVLKVQDIIGRSLAVTERPDDLGQGSCPTSKIDGNCGKPVACGIIARSAGVFQNPKRVCQCDGVVVWDERDRPLAGKGRSSCCSKDQDRGDTANPCYRLSLDRGNVNHYLAKRYQELMDYKTFAHMCREPNVSYYRKVKQVCKLYKNNPQRFRQIRQLYMSRQYVKTNCQKLFLYLLAATGCLLLAKIAGYWVIKYAMV